MCVKVIVALTRWPEGQLYPNFAITRVFQQPVTACPFQNSIPALTRRAHFAAAAMRLDFKYVIASILTIISREPWMRRRRRRRRLREGLSVVVLRWPGDLQADSGRGAAEDNVSIR